MPLRHGRLRSATTTRAILGAAAAAAVAAGATLGVPAPASAAGTATAPAATVGTRVALSGSLDHLPPGSRSTGALAGGTPITGEVGLQPADPAALDRFLAAISTPGDPLYRHYLARGEYGERFGASPAAIRAVVSWLHGAGIDDTAVSANRLAVTFTTTAGRAQGAFGARIDRYRLPTGRLAYAPASAPLLPRPVADVVSGVVGLSDVARATSHVELRDAVPRPSPSPSPAPAGVGPRAGAAVSGPQACSAASTVATDDSSYTQDQLAGAYGLAATGGPYAQGRLGAGVTVAIFELEPYTASDISAYQACFGTSVPITDVDVDGGPGNGAQSGEAALDIEQVIGMAPLAKISVYQGPYWTSASESQILDVYTQIATDDTAQVVTTSWGLCESSSGSSFINMEATQAFDQMAAQGQSVFAAAGDSGSEDCKGSTGSTALAVDDPGSQPTVTSVGGTSMTAEGPPPVESVWNDSYGAGGGGASSIWTSNPSCSGTPAEPNYCYQVGDGSGVSARTVPDVSGAADPYHGAVIYISQWPSGTGANPRWGVIGGTSAAAPMWAAILADTDQGCVGVQSSHWGDVVGETNPPLYRAAEATGSTAFHDITVGNNDFTGTNGGRYSAATGYDLASGWGTPNAASLVPALEPSGGCPSVTGLSVTSGPGDGGTSVTISGAGLGGASAVTFGGVSAAITGDSSTSVTATSPSSCGAGTVDVLVTTANGTSAAVSYDRFSFTTVGCPTTTAVTSGSGQSATVATTFANPLVATVTDGNGSPVSGVQVTFAAPTSGVSGTFAGACASGHPHSCVVATNGSGVATSSTLSAGTAAGAFSVSASAAGTTTATFTETATAGSPATVTATSGSGQSTAAGTSFANPLAVTVTDAYGNPVPDASVTFAAPASGASSTFAACAGGNPQTYSCVVATNASGVATSSTLTANQWVGGPYSVSASTGAAGPATFSLTNLVPPWSGSPGSLADFASDGQNANPWNVYNRTTMADGPAVTGTGPIYDPTDGFIHVFVRAANGDLVEYVDDGNGRAWNAYDHTLDAGGGSPIASSPDAVLDANGALHVYVESTAGHLVEYLPDHVGGHVWNAYDHTLDAGGGVVIGATPDAIIDTNGLVHVFVDSTAGHLVEYLPDHVGGRVWNAYDHTLDAGGAVTITGAANAIVDMNGLVHVYVESTAGHLVEYLPDHLNGYVWNAYDHTLDAGGAVTITASPSAVIDGNDLVHVYVDSTAGHLVEYLPDHLNGHVWNAYDHTLDAGGGGLIAGGPNALYDPAAKLVHIFVRSPGDDLVEYVDDHAGGNVWNAYDRTVGTSGPRIAADPTAVDDQGVLHVYAPSA